jgi:Ca2+-binding RTX toxin-like protein
MYKRNPRSTAVTPVMDVLEPRLLFSAPPTPNVQNGILKVWGTPGDDTIEVEYFTVVGAPTGADRTPFYGVYVDGTTTVVPATNIVGLHVHSGAGNDIIKLIDVDPNLISVPTPTGDQYTISSVMVAETVFAGRGDDLIDAGYGNPGPVFSVGIPGRTGTCAINVGAGNDTITGSYGVIYGGQGDDSITAGTNTTIYAGTGNDTINKGVYNVVIKDVGGNDTILGSPGPIAI